GCIDKDGERWIKRVRWREQQREMDGDGGGWRELDGESDWERWMERGGWYEWRERWREVDGYRWMKRVGWRKRWRKVD
ncbi:hypothetical protein A2U01_0062424, partial [Trifolium medium]|nr:hypothetical protein [Trifolium medium]